MSKTVERFAKTAVFHGADRRLEVCQIPVPELSAGEILVRNEYTTLCRSDLSTFTGKRKEATPTILGHEIVGRIERVGPEVGNLVDIRNVPLAPGDRVSWAIFASDPNSPLSLRGIPQKGAGLYKYGHERIEPGRTLHGGLSQYTILRPHTPIAKLSDAIPLPICSIVNCAVATVAGALRLAGDVSGKRILVAGAGMLGLVACAMARACGASEIAVLDTDVKRLQRSVRFGASELMWSQAVSVEAETKSELGVSIVDLSGDRMLECESFDAVLEFTGAASVMEQSLQWLAIGGVAVWVGAVHPGPSVAISAEMVVRRLLSIRGLHNYNREDFLRAIEFIESSWQQYPFRELVDDRFTLDNVNDAFRCGVEENPFRVGVRLE